MNKIFALYIRKKSLAKKYGIICDTTREDFLSSKLSKNILISTMILCLIIITCLATSFVIAQPALADEGLPRIEVLPDEGPIGTTVYVRIWNFTPIKQVIVLFNNETLIGSGSIVVAKEITDASGYAIANFNVDLLAGGRYTIIADDGTNTESVYFRITPQITLENTSGFVGDTITISGNGFAAEKPISVFFDDEKVTTGDTNENGEFYNINFILPQSIKGTHKIKVQDSEGNIVITDYNVKQKMTISPLLTSVSSNVTIIGTGFDTKDITIYFDDKDITAVTVDTSGSFTTIIKIPPCSDGTHKIKADDGVNRSYCEITIVSTMTISPDNGHINIPVGIQGSGFRPGFQVRISYDNSEIEGPTVSPEGMFAFNFKIPKSRSGPHTISASDGINTRQATFTVESTPPLAPALISPADSARIEKDISFQWSPVEDPSGVTYVLEIAKNTQFSERILSTSNLVQCELVLPDDDKLLPSQKAPYYWRVKAIDSASNEGAWSEISSFYRGHTLNTIFANMPDWTKYILICLGIILVAFMFFWVRRFLRRAGDIDEIEPEIDSESNIDPSWEYNSETNDWNQ